jgi:tryptophanyl-tRNA synthetase
VRVLSGIQPTGEKHLGNYVGAISRWVAEQHEVDAFHPIVDLHAITVPQEPEELREATLDLAALLIACGLDPDVCTLFVQSHVPEHPRLAWVLECMTPYGEVRRMPQFREKSAAQAAFSVGLMTYPVLQAADILLYDSDVVPVGEDQRQHVELARDLAQRFNQRFGETFVVPEGTYGEVGAKVMDLQDPESRMSTTLSSELGIVKVLDPPDTIRRKVRSAVTDSGREVVRAEDKPGVSNLIEIMAVATGATPDVIEARYDGTGYGKFKEEVAEAVIQLLDPVRLRYGELRGDPDRLAATLARGAEKAHTIAADTLARVHDAVGFAPPASGPTWRRIPPGARQPPPA